MKYSEEKRLTKRSKKTTKSWLRTFSVALFPIFVAISISGCCSSPEPVKPRKEFKSLKHLKRGEKMPYEGWSMSNSDFKDLLEILAEIERKSGDN